MGARGKIGYYRRRNFLFRRHAKGREPAGGNDGSETANPGTRALLGPHRFARPLYAGDEEAARRWLGEPSRGLGGRKPVDMLTTSAESESVLDLIGRLEHGVVA